jgi:hypothetical protein
VTADFSLKALALQRADGADARYVNFNDRHSAAEFALGLVDGGPMLLVVDGVLEWLDDDGVDNVLSIVRWVLRDGDRAILRSRIRVDGDRSASDHGDGHLTPEYLADALRRNAVAPDPVHRSAIDPHHADETVLLTPLRLEER